MNLALVLASELTEKTLWDPTVLGILVFISALVLFVGSIYLLLATNVGARLGFLLTGAGMSGLMVLMSVLWVTTAYPLNTIRGTLPGWTPIAITAEPGDTIDVAALKGAESGENIFISNRAEFANIKAVADTNLVIPASEGGREPEVNDFQTAGGFQSVDAVIIGGIWEVIEDQPLFFKDRRYALIEFCPAANGTVAVGDTPASCDAGSARFLAAEYDYGSLRVPPIVAFFASLAAFVLFLLALHWYEKDEREAETAAAGLPVPVGAK